MLKVAVWMTHKHMMTDLSHETGEGELLMALFGHLASNEETST